MKRKATQKNLLVLARLEERMEAPSGRACDHYAGHSALTTHDLRRGERYHADRLVRLGFLKKTRSRAPWHGPRPVTLYWRDAACCLERPS